MYPKPYSIYFRGAIRCYSQGSFLILLPVCLSNPVSPTGIHPFVSWAGNMGNSCWFVCFARPKPSWTIATQWPSWGFGMGIPQILNPSICIPQTLSNRGYHGNTSWSADAHGSVLLGRDNGRSVFFSPTCVCSAEASIAPLVLVRRRSI